MSATANPYQTRRANTEARNSKIIEMVNVLYNEQRLRYDIIRQHVCETFYISESTFYKIVQKPKQ